jgi:hypothetical protein
MAMAEISYTRAQQCYTIQLRDDMALISDLFKLKRRRNTESLLLSLSSFVFKFPVYALCLCLNNLPETSPWPYNAIIWLRYITSLLSEKLTAFFYLRLNGGR